MGYPSPTWVVRHCRVLKGIIPAPPRILNPESFLSFLFYEVFLSGDIPFPPSLPMEDYLFFSQRVKWITVYFREGGLPSSSFPSYDCWIPGYR